MLRNYFRSALRTLWKNKVFSLINIAGLSLGMASIATLAVLVNQYVSTDDFFANKERMYYLKTFTPDGQSYRQTTFPLLYEIERTCPEVAAVTHWQGYDAPWLTFGEKEIQEQTYYVDTAFLEVLSFPMKEGNAATALDKEYSVVISERVRQQLFGEEPAAGKFISVNDTLQVSVTGVIAIPPNSSLKGDVFFPMEFLKGQVQGFDEMANWYNTFAESYLLLHPDADIEQLNAKINGLVQRFYHEGHRDAEVRVAPFSDLKTESGDLVQKIIIGAGASAGFILLIMVINLINLNMATALGRSREVAVRRIIGSGKGTIALQFCLENALLMVASLAIAFGVFKGILLPWTSEIVGGQLGELYFREGQALRVSLLMLLVACFVVLIAAGLPAMRLTSLKVTEAVKGLRARGNYSLRNVFITLQFALGIVFLCIAVVLNRQIHYMKAAAPGFNKENLAVVDLDLAFRNREQAAGRLNGVLADLRANPYVEGFSTSQVIPTRYDQNYNQFMEPGGNKEVHLRQVTVDAGFVSAFQIPIVEGRNFNDELEATEGNKVIINETAVKEFGWSEPIGKTLVEGSNTRNTLTVIGVMKDFHYNNLKDPVEPLLHWYGGKQGLNYNRYLSIRVGGGHSAEVLAGLEHAFAGIPSRKAFSFQHMSDLVDKQYSLVEGILRITSYVAVLAILIACMGILGLVVLVARHRTREIGIRKVLGATVASVVALLARDFVKLVLIAVLIATPLAWYLMQKWLEDFAYHVDIHWWMFALAGLLAVLIALLTVSFQSIKAALVNPVNSLRSE
ncbi:putative ABC transport system permease protein [Anseongella ginsenosidimutans]|uniref:Putative ABC transport system permease protein n=1 Tax=Anseongella ginsenosidimutans TaxID=496056 RepID=A0A4R3KM91_9SPHI|nr:ABC transporter permease [Anseongella ginsenosidimutans]QEC52468.1 FtsX-like permease family protein [Anseongella ginsenosidimutans]TCS85355.1 putative ABC transport system permease protein [Anseongella ginsenosidimutans]